MSLHLKVDGVKTLCLANDKAWQRQHRRPTLVNVELFPGGVVVEVHPHVVTARRPLAPLSTVTGALYCVWRLRPVNNPAL